LGQLLRGHDAERQAGVDEFGRQRACRPLAALDNLGEADLLGVGHSLLDRGEGLPLKEIGCVHAMPGAPQLVGKSMEALRLTHRVVEQQHVSHPRLLPENDPSQ
jgi:hypothetical protein